MDADDAARHFLFRQTPLDSIRVVRRAQVLACLVCRADIERGAGQIEAEAAHQKMLAWITAFDLWSEMEPSEKDMVLASLGALNEAEVIRAAWRVEGLAVLSWAANRFDLPLHDVQVDPFRAAESVGFLEACGAEPISTVPRTSAELTAYRELIYAVHSRLRDFERHSQSKNFASWIEPSWIKLLGIEASHLLFDDDLAIDENPLAFANETRVAECLWITRERHKAIVWLVGSQSVYSQVSADI